MASTALIDLPENILKGGKGMGDEGEE